MAFEVYAKVGAAIRSRRNAIGMTQASLATKAGLGRTSVTNIENGSQSILVHQLIDVANALRFDPKDFLVGLECKPREPEAVNRTGLLVDLLGKLDRPVQTRRR